ncbi:MAG: hypothetical protein EON48_01170 [Acetobacteraceae bacterium]|nr:MAG: hypothetical protein EON48_01170 [Acetobacteraceae bacterium]
MDRNTRLGDFTAKDGKAAGSNRFGLSIVMAPHSVERLGVRRTVVAALASVIALTLAVLSWNVLAAGGWTLWEALMMLSVVVNAPWIGLTAATGLAGLAIRLCVPNPSTHVFPSLRRTGSEVHDRTLLALCVRLEDMDTILPSSGRLLRELRTRHGDRFVLGILSDTPHGRAAEMEAEAVAAFAAQFPDGAVRYRRRVDNAGFKQVI